MHSAVVTACVLIVGGYAPATSLRQQSQQAFAQAQTAPPERPVRTERHQRGASRLDIPVAEKSAVARKRAEALRSSRGPTTDAQPQQPDNRQLPAAAGLLLALALLNGSDATPPVIPQPETN
jgi:hypothetical protein